MLILPIEARMFPPKVEVPVPTWNVLLPVTVVGPLSETVLVPVENVFDPVWEKVLSRVVAPWKVSDPGVVVEPMVLLDEAPLPNVLVVLIPVARVVLPEEVIVVDELFGIVTVPVPNVTGLLVVVLMERVVAEVRSMIGFKDEMFVETLFKVSMPVPVVNVLLPVILVFPLSDTTPVPVEKEPLPDWMKFELFWIVTVPLDVNPEVVVRRPEMVGVAVHAVPVTVKSPPNVVSPVPTLKVLDPDTSVFPFKVFAPVPVEKVPVPF
ncbi:MAG: hypothetical protein NTV03_03790 [Candidatus Nomurabacteria bacterium]|nr:hypothetical protein [Candidatus Nomurabacteria bacterium]